MTDNQSTEPPITRIVAFLGDPGLTPTTYSHADIASERQTKLPWQAWRQLAGEPDGVLPPLIGICSDDFCQDWRHHLADDADDAGLDPETMDCALMQYRTDDATGSEESVWDLFEMIRHALSEASLSQRDDFQHLSGDKQRLDRKPTRVVVDITHGFRALPFLGAAVLAFLSAANRRANHRIDYRICYAAADSVAEGHPAPVWDLSRSFQLIELGDAADAFLRHGRADDIAEFFEQSSSSAARALARPMRDFADDSLLMRVPAILKASAPALNTRFEQRLTDVIRAYPPLRHDLETLHARIGELIGTADRDATMSKPGLQATLALAERLRDTGRYAELYNLLRESLITAFGVVALTDPETSPQPGSPDSKDFRDGLETDCRNLGELDADKRDGPRGIAKCRRANYCQPLAPIAGEIAGQFSQIREQRNDVAHCSMSDKAAPQEQLREQLHAWLERFRMIVDRITTDT